MALFSECTLQCAQKNLTAPTMSEKRFITNVKTGGDKRGQLLPLFRSAIMAKRWDAVSFSAVYLAIVVSE